VTVWVRLSCRKINHSHYGGGGEGNSKEHAITQENGEVKLTSPGTGGKKKCEGER